MSVPCETEPVCAPGIYPIRAATFRCGAVDAIGQSPICNSAVIEVLDGGKTATVRGLRDMCPEMEYIRVIEEINGDNAWQIQLFKPESPPSLPSVFLRAGGYSLTVHLASNTPFVPTANVVAP